MLSDRQYLLETEYKYKKGDQAKSVFFQKIYGIGIGLFLVCIIFWASREHEICVANLCFPWPPVLIAVSSALTPSDSFREMEDYAATACSIQNFCLSLWGNGIGTQWSTGTITRADSTYEALGIPKDRERIVGFLKVGYPETLPEKEKLDVESIRTYLP